MNKKAKEAISAVSTVVTTAAVVSTVTYLTGLGTAGLFNAAFKEGFRPWEARVISGIITTGSLGIGIAAGMVTYPHIKNCYDAILDILPPLPGEEVNGNG